MWSRIVDHVSVQSDEISDDDADTTREQNEEVWLSEDEEDILDDVHPPELGSLTTAEGVEYLCNG